MAIQAATSGNAEADKVYEYLVARIEGTPAHLRDEIRRGHMTCFVPYRGLQDRLELEPDEVDRALQHLHARGFIDVTHWRGHGADFFFRRSIESRVA